MTTFAATTNADAFSALRSQAAAAGVTLGVLSDVAATALTVANLLGSTAITPGTGDITLPGGLTVPGQVYSGRTALKVSVQGMTVSALGTTQNSTPSAAQLQGGLVTQTGATGAGTVTLPIGSVLDAAVTGAAVGDTFECIFANLGGGFTLTITGGGGTTVLGTAAVPTGKFAQLLFVRTGSNAWSVYCVVSA